MAPRPTTHPRRPATPAAGTAAGSPRAKSAYVVVVRALNLGGSSVVRTSEVPKRLPDWSVANIGAAGTFVVRGARTAEDVQRRFATAIGYPTDVLVREETEFRRLWSERPAAWSSGDLEERRYVTFLRESPRRPVPLPHAVPSAALWEVRLDALVGREVLSSHLRRGDRRAFYANEVVERLYGIPGTTRGWETLERVAARLTP